MLEAMACTQHMMKLPNMIATSSLQAQLHTCVELPKRTPATVELLGYGTSVAAGVFFTGQSHVNFLQSASHFKTLRQTRSFRLHKEVDKEKDGENCIIVIPTLQYR